MSLIKHHLLNTISRKIFFNNWWCNWSSVYCPWH